MITIKRLRSLGIKKISNKSSITRQFLTKNEVKEILIDTPPHLWGGVSTT